ncbi:hypothetical protein BB560_001972 [Smittium megazygosporum]|uniref:ATPase inhibitor, mitochondrial n=1 Tax=Smittium megazygosporum TaxID=133381 RepID=A0A2T9ZG26_9FUNG|nr:hypothetical protein BB560_001972 [Smittium megazygosporum]
MNHIVAQGRFGEREKAAEDMYIHQVEKEKLAALRKKLAEKMEEVDQLSKEMDNFKEGIKNHIKK